MKKLQGYLILIIACCLLLTLACVPMCEAQELHIGVFDTADLMTETEEAKLRKLASEYSEKFEVDVVFVTTPGIGDKTPTEFADDFYDYNGYGENGILFLISMEERDICISTAGTCIRAFDDYEIREVIKTTSTHATNGNYYKFMKKACEKSFEAMNDYYKTILFPDVLIVSPIGMLVCVIITTITMLVLFFTSKSPATAPASSTYAEYCRAENVNENYMGSYEKVHRGYYQSSSSSSSGSRSSGGSSHRSSSGRSHGGGSGKF